MLKIGDSIKLEPVYSSKLEKYKCRLVEKKDNRIYIDYPINIDTNKTVFLSNGTQLKVTFIHSTGAVYFFHTEIMGRTNVEVPMLILHLPPFEEFTKIQRRQYNRVETAVDVAIHPLINGDFSPLTAITNDISAGGASIVVQNMPSVIIKELQFITYLVLPLQNGEYSYMETTCRVVGIAHQSNGIDRIHVQFVNITPEDRQKIIRFCFDRQLSLRKKGLRN